MSEVSFHSDTMYMLGSALLEPELATEQDLLRIQNKLLMAQIAELKELTQMQNIDVESHRSELMHTLADFNNKITAYEIDVLRVQIDLCQKHIDICGLRFDLYKLQRTTTTIPHNKID
jgi:hypothetical protein